MQGQTKFTSWKRTGPIAKKLVEHFNLFHTTKGEAGIVPSIVDPATIREIRIKNEFLHPLNPSYFPDHFRTLGNSWRLNKDSTRKGMYY